jgi:cell wall-associated NlpC family hydrolase
MKTPTRVEVVAEAMSWEGTKYHHMGRLKQKRNDLGEIVDPGGIDCAQLIFMVFDAVDGTEEMPLYNYSMQEWIHREDEKLLREILTRAKPTNTPRPGDVVIYKMGRSYGHAALVIEPGWPHIIHAHRQAGKVMTDIGDLGQMAGRKRLFFTIWDD